MSAELTGRVWPFWRITFAAHGKETKQVSKQTTRHAETEQQEHGYRRNRAKGTKCELTSGKAVADRHLDVKETHSIRLA
jgi:hypothetical protein